MSSKVDHYINRLKNEKKLIHFLQSESNLPGPRANIELAKAFARIADEHVTVQLCEYDADIAPTNDPKEFLCFCGILALGKFIARGKPQYFTDLKRFASDPRWRAREAVAMALQSIGRKDPLLLLSEMMLWARGSLYQKRAVAAALCDPVLLADRTIVEQTFIHLNKITREIPLVQNKREEDFKVLRKALGYCWSVAISAEPKIGIPTFEKLMEINDKDVKWILKENLKKNRFKKLDPIWAEKHLVRLFKEESDLTNL